MMIKPGISELQKSVDSRYTLVAMAAKRARMLGGKEDDNGKQIIKPVSVAVEEIADGKVGYVRHDYDRQLDTDSVCGQDIDYDAGSVDGVTGENTAEDAE